MIVHLFQFFFLFPLCTFSLPCLKKKKKERKKGKSVQPMLIFQQITVIETYPNAAAMQAFGSDPEVQAHIGSSGATGVTVQGTSKAYDGK